MADGSARDLLPAVFGNPMAHAESADEKTLFVVDRRNSKHWLTAVEISSGKITGRLFLSADDLTVNFSRDGRWLVAFPHPSSLDAPRKGFLFDLSRLSLAGTGIWN